MDQKEQFLQAVTHAQNVLLLTHVNEDGDSIGSSLALAILLRSLKKSATVLLSAPPPMNLSFLGDIPIYHHGMEIPRYDLVIAVDCASPDRMGERFFLFESALHTAVIDHHASNKGYAEVNWIDGNAAATGLLVYALFVSCGLSPSPEAATALYTAIFTDTGGFHYTNTSPEVLRTGAALIEAGADHNAIYTQIYETVSLARFRVQAVASSRAEFFYGGKLAIVCLPYEVLLQAGAKPEDTENISSLLRTINGVEVAVFLRETQEGTLRGSIRTRDRVNAASVAAHFGGGGHDRAGGFSSDLSLIKVRDTLVSMLSNDLSI